MTRRECLILTGVALSLYPEKDAEAAQSQRCYCGGVDIVPVPLGTGAVACRSCGLVYYAPFKRRDPR